jgi:hypothetical protein
LGIIKDVEEKNREARKNDYEVDEDNTTVDVWRWILVVPLVENNF